MIDGLARVREDCGGQMPSNIVVINGPSKTADIEMNLVTGVHGPKYVYVLVVE
jgi:L-lactate dehydrogenase complex protein LldG